MPVSYIFVLTAVLYTVDRRRPGIEHWSSPQISVKRACVPITTMEIPSPIPSHFALTGFKSCYKYKMKSVGGK